MSKKQPDGQNALFLFVLTLIIALTISVMPSDDGKKNDQTLMDMVPSVTEHRLTEKIDSHVAASHEEAHEAHTPEVSGHGEAGHGTVAQVEKQDAQEAHGSTDAAHGTDTHGTVDAPSKEEVAASSDHATAADADGHEAETKAHHEAETHETVADAHETKAADKEEPSHEAPEKAESVASEADGAVSEETAPEKETVAGSGTVANVIVMESDVYDKHNKDMVHFTHKKHFETYAIACGACHHDDSGAPLEDLKLGDPVEKCSACHDKTGKTPKGASAAEKIQYHKQALHDNCIACHKDHNKKNNTKAAPQSCKACHAHAKGAQPEGVENVETAPSIEADAAKEKKEETEVAAPVEADKNETASDAVEAVTAQEKGAAETETAADKPEGDVAAESAKSDDAGEKGVQAADIIAMESAVYEKHSKGIVQFTHKKHIEDYTIACGACHHDDSGAPLEDLKMGDPVQKCGECHDQVGKAPKDASDAEKLGYHKEALHQNCIACHKAYNKEKNTKAAPASCSKCHPKDK